MRIGCFVLMLTLTTSACAQKDHSSSQLKSDDEKIDSVFTQYFNVLDLYLKDREFDRSGRRMDAIHLWKESAEHIPAEQETSQGNLPLLRRI
jgi:hypothetical protein